MEINKFRGDRGGQRRAPSEKWRNTLWPCFRHGDRARTENPGNHPHRPSPNRPRSNTDTSRRVCTPLRNRVSIWDTHIATIFQTLFQIWKKFAPSWVLVSSFFRRQSNNSLRRFVYDYWAGCEPSVFRGGKFRDARFQK